MKLNLLGVLTAGALVFAGTTASASTVIFADNFNRPDSNFVNVNISPDPWFDAIEDDPNDVAIRDNQLRLRDNVSGLPDAGLSSVIIDARGLSGVTLSFDWRALPNNEANDFLYVSYDIGGNEPLWQTDTDPDWVLAFSGSDDGTSTRSEVISLAGVDNRRFRLAFWTDVSTSSEGFMLDNVSVSAVPLPASSLLLLGGLGAMVAVRRRKSKAA